MEYAIKTSQDSYLVHYGKIGMKWGVRHDKPRSSSGRRRSKTKKTVIKSSNKTNFRSKIKEKFSKIDKEKVKNVGKTTAVIAGKVAAGALLGSVGVMAINELSKAYHIVKPPSLDISTKSAESTGEKMYNAVRKNRTALLYDPDIKRKMDESILGQRDHVKQIADLTNIINSLPRSTKGQDASDNAYDTEMARKKVREYYDEVNKLDKMFGRL